MKRMEKYFERQNSLSEELILENGFKEINRIGSVDQAFNSNVIISGLVILDYKNLEILDKKWAKEEEKFPYVSGLLCYREGPPILKVVKKLEKEPDVLIVDGFGVCHPRKLGLASYVGIKLDLPTIGVAKNKLVGRYKEPEKVGEVNKITYKGEHVGFVLKSKEDCNPIFISPGHKVSINTSLKIVKKCLKHHKLPEPLYKAHQYANEIKRSLK